MPDVVKIAEIQEPWIEATILTPDEYLGSVLKLCQDRRGSQKELTDVGSRAMVKYDLPLIEVVFDFYDRLKSVSVRAMPRSTTTSPTTSRPTSSRCRSWSTMSRSMRYRCWCTGPAPKAAAAPWSSG